MSILIVEDNVVSAKLMQINLEKMGYSSVSAKNGLEAIEQLKENLDIRLVITDILMPDMDGLTLFTTIRSTPLFQNIPVIICSSVGDAPTIKKAASLGCRYYLLKPFSFDEIKRKVSEALSEEKKAIKSKAEIIREYRLKEDSYNDLASTFRVVLEEQRAVLESNQNALKDTSLHNLCESARIFGAEGLLSALDQLQHNLKADIFDASINNLIIREISAVLNLLPTINDVHQ